MIKQNMDHKNSLSSNEIKLIRLIKERTRLFYKDPKLNFVKEDLWKEVATQLNSDVSECQKQWINLRNRFIELLHHPPDGITRESIFYGEMNFLRKRINLKKYSDEHIPPWYCDNTDGAFPRYKEMKPHKNETSPKEEPENINNVVEVDENLEEYEEYEVIDEPMDNQISQKDTKENSVTKEENTLIQLLDLGQLDDQEQYSDVEILYDTEETDVQNVEDEIQNEKYETIWVDVNDDEDDIKPKKRKIDTFQESSQMKKFPEQNIKPVENTTKIENDSLISMQIVETIDNEIKDKSEQIDANEEITILIPQELLTGPTCADKSTMTDQSEPKRNNCDKLIQTEKLPTTTTTEATILSKQKHPLVKFFEGMLPDYEELTAKHRNNYQLNCHELLKLFLSQQIPEQNSNDY